MYINIIIKLNLFLYCFIVNKILVEKCKINLFRKNNKKSKFFKNILERNAYYLCKSTGSDEGSDNGIFLLISLFSFYISFLIIISSFPFIPVKIIDTMSFVVFTIITSIFMTIPISIVIGFKHFNRACDFKIPLIFNIFLPLLETAQFILRTIILGIRITANLTAGHLLVMLLSSFISLLFINKNLLYFPIFLFILILNVIINVLEVIISLIQIYILFILFVFYSNIDM